MKGRSFAAQQVARVVGLAALAAVSLQALPVSATSHAPRPCLLGPEACLNLVLLARDRGVVPTHFALAVVLLRMGRLEEAVRYFVASLRWPK